MNDRRPTGSGLTGGGPTGSGLTGGGPTGRGLTSGGPTGSGPTGSDPTGRGPAGRGRLQGDQGRQRGADRGAAVVDFVLVGALLTLLFVSVLQLALVLHVRATLVACAGEGARYGALADRSPADGAQRTRELIAADLGAGYARQVSAGRQRFHGLDTVVVRVRAPLPVAGLLGAGHVLAVEGHASPEEP